jgi:uncharacterized protein (DUF4415 family)
MPSARKRKPAIKAPKNRRRRSGTDMRRLTALTEREIEQMAARDPDNPATDEAYWASASVGLPPPKTYIHAGFDADVVKWFKSEGRGYQTRMNAVLRRYMEARRKAG